MTPTGAGSRRALPPPLPSLAALTACGAASLLIWATIPGLRPHGGPTVPVYLARYFAAFALYLGAVIVIFRLRPGDHRPTLLLIWLFALLFRLPLSQLSPPASRPPASPL